MTGKQKIGDSLFDHVLMATITTYKLALSNLCLQQQPMKVSKKLFVFKRCTFRLGFWNIWEIKLIGVQESALRQHIKIENKNDSGAAYFSSHSMQRLPIDAGNDIANKIWLEINFLELEFDVAEMEGECCG
jgi:hypothetical protein